MRHRVGSFNSLSLRYCIAERCYYVPADADVDVYRAHMRPVRPLRALGGPAGAERARGVLGTAVYSEFVWTVNAWSLMNWLSKRLDKGAQWEHRQYALAALEIWREVMPVTATAFVEGMLRPLGLEEK